MAQGSSVIPSVPVSLWSQNLRLLVQARSSALFSLESPPLPPLPCLASFHLPRSAVPWAPVPGGSLEGVNRLSRGSCASSRQPSGLSGLTGQVLSFLCLGSQTPHYVFCFSPLGHSHPAGLMGSSSPSWGHRCLVPYFSGKHCSSLSTLLPCGLPAIGTD